VDADIRAEPELLRSAVTLAHTRKVDMLSVNPFQELVSTSERLLLPGVFISIAASMDMEGVNDPSKPEAIANGQFILFRRSTYNAMKGHYAVRDEIMEDLAFARLTKRSGYRLFWLFGDQLIRTRMYRNFPKIWEGFSKNLTEIMRTRGIAHELFTAAKSFVLGWLPVVLPILTWQNLSQGAPAALRYGAFWLSAIAAFALLGNNLMTVRALRLPIGYALSVQLGYLLHAALIIASLWKKRKGKREWKGRVYE
jgi:chlorobactene glucosyltransferase